MAILGLAEIQLRRGAAAFAFAALFLAPCLAFSANRADFSVPSIEVPTSIYYHGKPHLAFEGSFLEGLNLPGGRIACHEIGFKATAAGPGMAMGVSFGGRGYGDLSATDFISVENDFRIDLAASFGIENLAFGFSWNVSGARESEIAVASVPDSFARFYENLLVKRNDANIRNIQSDFALSISYALAGILSLSVYSDRFLSLSSQAVSFSANSLASSLGFAFSLKTPKYDSLMNLRSFLADLHVSVLNLLSASPGMDIDVRMKLVLSGRMDITMSNLISFGDFLNVTRTSSHTIEFIFRHGGFSPSVSVTIPFLAYARASGDSAIRLAIALRYET